ncbi:hypothetical protein CONLIGDRAFT_678001 [Coniochaeta ligniaria NRRL 30616]|uniref:Uncharacterized protein n=1 Tax=Coniochaeta ligniaria NRRL 30616 TaxID=1408157 RepID=A0A1J7IVL6_9PEZI|nr:hypothetical protein CONLIGDRAFT_678001 [Coniochaeta ligniaria NRRL 30616]
MPRGKDIIKDYLKDDFTPEQWTKSDLQHVLSKWWIETEESATKASLDAKPALDRRRVVNKLDIEKDKGPIPIEILMMPYYRAQVQTYEELLQKALLDKALTSEQRARIRVATLDASQGDKADLTFIDFGKIEPRFKKESAAGGKQPDVSPSPNELADDAIELAMKF